MIHQPALKLSILLLITLTASACQINKHATRESPKKPQLAEITRAPETPEPQTPEYSPGALRLNPASDLTTNPSQFGKFKGTASRHLAQFYDLDYKTCHGFIEPKPSLIINTSNTSEPYQITAHGDIDVLFIEFSDREVVCQRRSVEGADPVIQLPNPRGRSYRVYAGRFQKRAPVDYSLTFENLDQPISVAWLDADVTTLQVDNDLTAPQLLALKTTPHSESDDNIRSPEHGNDACTTTPGRMSYALEPEVRLDIKQTADVTLGIRSPNPAHMTLVGPIPADQRDIPTRCLPSHTESLTLEAGTYYIRIGLEPDTPQTTLQFFAHGTAAGLDPLTNFPQSATDNLPTTARALSMHYPFLTADLLLTNDAIRQQLFSNAPASLYVVATEDISTDHAASIFHGTPQADDKLLQDERKPEFPRKDELLLLLNTDNLVLAADGSLFVIPTQYLKPAEQADVITLPTTARNTRTYLRHALQLTDDSDQGRLDQYNQRLERYQQCADKTVSNQNPANSPHVTKTCGLERLNTENQRLWRQLEDNRTTRRNNALQIIRARLADLVLVK